MRIAFDLDGTLADLHTPFARAALDLFPELDPSAVAPVQVGASPPDTDEAVTDGSDGSAAPVSAPTFALPLSNAQTGAVWRALEAIEDFWETLTEIEEGSIRRLAQLADERRWEVIFVTSRPRSRGRTVQRQSQHWLERCGFPLPSVYVVHGSRGRIADALALDVVVDDRPENCLDVVLESRAGSILLWRGDSSGVPASARRMGIAVVPTIARCLDALAEAERPGQETRFVDRLRRVLGLKSRPTSAFLR
jgi:hypothetical protein